MAQVWTPERRLAKARPHWVPSNGTPQQTDDLGPLFGSGRQPQEPSA